MTAEEIRQKLKDFKEQAKLERELIDEDTDSNILNNQAVLAYQKGNYAGTVELFLVNLDRFMLNTTSYFNFLVLCWESGVYSDDFVLNELSKNGVNPYTGRSFTSFLFGVLYEAQNNWHAARVNYGLAFQSAGDSTVAQIRQRLRKCETMSEKHPESLLTGHLELSDVQDIVVSYNGRFAASFQRTSRVIVWNLASQKILKEIEDKNATCMDASARMDRIAVGLRSGLIVIFTLTYDGEAGYNEAIVNVDETELGVRSLI